MFATMFLAEWEQNGSLGSRDSIEVLLLRRELREASSDAHCRNDLRERALPGVVYKHLRRVGPSIA